MMAKYKGEEINLIPTKHQDEGICLELMKIPKKSNNKSIKCSFTKKN